MQIRSHQDQIQRWLKSKPLVSWTWWISYSHAVQVVAAAACCFAVVVVVVDEMGRILGVLVVSGEEGGVARTRFECCC